MKGIITGFVKEEKTGVEYATIESDRGDIYYSAQNHLEKGCKISDLKQGDSVDISKTSLKGDVKIAERVILLEQTASETDSFNIYDYYKPGYYKHLDTNEMNNKHLKKDSGELEVIEKLKNILYISHVNHHDMGGNCIFPFLLIGTTEFLKQYIHGKYEFLLIFSHFPKQDWQQNTLKVAKFIRQRRKIIDRKPLVNFYVLISNAKNLKAEIDKQKGGTDAAVIPFSFEEILSCSTKKELQSLFLNRFDEYIFENNMLGEESPIEQDILLFGDRGKIADSIVQRCKEKKHSGIFGLRRSGKSSVLHAVRRRLDTESIKYVMIEARSQLASVDSWKTALFDIAREVRISTSELVQNNGENRAQYNKRLNLNSTEQDYERRPTQCFVEDVKLYTRDEDAFIIAIDEIELITYNTATSQMWQDLDSYHNFWSALRDSGCSLIVCGVNSTINENNTIEYNNKNCDNPMYERIHLCADFSKSYLPSFTDEQTKVMINTLGSYSNIAFNHIYVDINRAFGGQPFPIRQFCSFLFEKVKDKRSRDKVYEISKATFNAYLPEFNDSPKGIKLYNTILQHIRIYQAENEMLTRIAFSPEKYRKIEHKDINLIDHLEKYGLIEYDKTTECITFNITSLQDYIKKTGSKDPHDMNNDERRQYIQSCVAVCEKKLKKYILSYYKITGDQSRGKQVMRGFVNNGKIIPKHNAVPVLDPNTCPLDDFFDHNKFIFYFSTLKTIITSNWSTLGRSIESSGIKKDRFRIYMEDLNAGRSDADHYDAEDMNPPTKWEIDDNTLQKFTVAYTTIKPFLDNCAS